MGKSMSLFNSRSLITYEISILKLFYLLGVCNCCCQPKTAVWLRHRSGAGPLVVVELPWPSPHIATNPLCFGCSAQPTSPAFRAKLRRLTPLGNHLAQLPVDAGCAKLLASHKNLVIFAEFCRTWKLGTMWALWKCLFKNCISVLLFWI